MPRTITFDVPTNPSQFGPEQIRPRVLLGLSMEALARWFAAYLDSYSRLLHEHRIGFVFTTIRLDYGQPPLRFADADWLTITARTELSASAKYLRSTVDVHTSPTDGASRCVGRFAADLRVVGVVEDRSLTGVPGVLCDPLRHRFAPAEVYEPDLAERAAAATPPEGGRLLGEGRFDFTLCRTQCEVADQWSFVEIMETLPMARERLYLDGRTPAPAGLLAVRQPIRTMVAVFHRAMYVFDQCHINTQAWTAPPDAPDETVFLHSIDDPVHQVNCVTAWEILGYKVRSLRDIP